MGTKIKFIGMKEFRDNLSKAIKKAKKEGITYIVLKKNVPVFEVSPIEESDIILHKERKAVAQARLEVEKGQVYSQEDVAKMLDL